VAIEAASGLSVAFRSEGRLLVALDAAREAALATFLADLRPGGLTGRHPAAAEIAPRAARASGTIGLTTSHAARRPLSAASPPRDAREEAP
jgi:hypothetical protein